MLYFFVLLLIGVIAFVLLLSAMLALGIGVGWLLTLFLPFTLFEGSVLGLIAVTVSGMVGFSLLRRLSKGPDNWEDFLDDDFDLDDPPVNVIPPSRIIEDDDDPTWRNWFQYLFANDIYGELMEFGDHIARMNDSQKQELSIRLSDVIVTILSAKPVSTKRLRITREQVKKKMTKMGMRPYDDDILDLALDAVDENLDVFQSQILNVIRTRSWDRPSDIPYATNKSYYD